MLKGNWKYGTQLRAEVLTVFDCTVPAYALKDENGEGHLLYNIRHAILPNIGDRVVMEFTKGKPMGGYWRIVSFDDVEQKVAE